MISAPSIDRYYLGKVLGEGGYCQVRLCFDKETGNPYAVKFPKRELSQQQNMPFSKNEIIALKQTEHPYIIKLVDYGEGYFFSQEGKQEEKSVYIVLEMVPNGDLFDIIQKTGHFNEHLARFYFRQLIEAVEHMHSRGYAHRDLKLDNLLLDSYFNLKIADLGFSAPLAGKDGSGKLHSVLGTPYYMAPELFYEQPYDGSVVDLFAVGVILFILVCENPPFEVATGEDYCYKLLIMNKQDHFWHIHASDKPGKLSFFSNEIRHLINSMLSFRPDFRLSIPQIKAHPWYNGPVPRPEDVFNEMYCRKNAMDMGKKSLVDQQDFLIREQILKQREEVAKQQEAKILQEISDKFNGLKIFNLEESKESSSGQIEESNQISSSESFQSPAQRPKKNAAGIKVFQGGRRVVRRENEHN